MYNCIYLIPIKTAPEFYENTRSWNLNANFDIHVSELSVNPPHKIWLSTKHDLFWWDGLQLVKPQNFQLASDINVILDEQNLDAILIGTDTGKILTAKNHSVELLVDLSKFHPDIRILDLKSTKSAYFIGTNMGLFYWDSKEDQLVRISRELVTQINMDSNFIWTLNQYAILGYRLEIDQNKQTKINTPVITIPFEKLGASPSQFFIESDTSWFLFAHRHVYQFNQKSDQLTKINISPISKIIQSQDQSLWIVTKDSLIRKVKHRPLQTFSWPKKSPDETVISVATNNLNQVYIGTSTGYLHQFVPSKLWQKKNKFLHHANITGRSGKWLVLQSQKKWYTFDIEKQEKLPLHIDPEAIKISETPGAIIFKSPGKIQLFNQNVIQTTPVKGLDITSAISNGDQLTFGTRSKGLYSFKSGKLKPIGVPGNIAYQLQSIQYLFIDQKESLWVNSNYGLYQVKTNSNWKKITDSDKLFINTHSILKDGKVLLGAQNGALLLVNTDNNYKLLPLNGFDQPIGQLHADRFGRVWVLCPTGIYFYEPQQLKTTQTNVLNPPKLFYRFQSNEIIDISQKGVAFNLNDSLLVMGFKQQHIKINTYQRQILAPKVTFNRIHVNGAPVHFTDSLILKKVPATVTIYLNDLGYGYPNPKEIRYRIIGKQLDWKYLQHQNFIYLNNWESGIYTIEVEEMNNPASRSQIYIQIIENQYQEVIFIGAIILIILSLIIYFIHGLFVKRFNMIIRELNEQIIQEQDQVAHQKKRMAIQLKEREVTKSIIHQKNQLITDSILFARKIQEALMPDETLLSNYFREFFIIHKPKDIVSGDFFWHSRQDDKIILAAVDCTGHGVPGAFMSIIGANLLHQIIEIEQITSPEKILTTLQQKLAQLLNANQERESVIGGMDVCLITIDLAHQVLYFAGAMRPLYIVQNENIIELKGDRIAIETNQNLISRFTVHQVNIEPNMMVYLTSDGFADQFGGEQNKKYMVKRLRAQLTKIGSWDSKAQKQHLLDEFNHWKGDAKQLDDILLVGIKI